MHELENAKLKELLNVIGQTLAKEMPFGYGFTLLIFGYETHDMFYISSANRDDMIKTMEEMLPTLRTHKHKV